MKKHDWKEVLTRTIPTLKPKRPKRFSADVWKQVRKDAIEMKPYYRWFIYQLKAIDPEDYNEPNSDFHIVRKAMGGLITPKNAWSDLSDDQKQCFIKALKDLSIPTQSPLETRLLERFSPEIAEAIEKSVCVNIEHYETMDVEEEKKHYPKIKSSANELLDAIKDTLHFRIYLHREIPDFLEAIEKCIERAEVDSRRFPARRQGKVQGRSPMLAVVIANVLKAHRVKLTKYDSDKNQRGKFSFAIRAVFERLDLHVKDTKYIIKHALETLDKEKALLNMLAGLNKAPRGNGRQVSRRPRRSRAPVKAKSQEGQMKRSNGESFEALRKVEDAR